MPKARLPDPLRLDVAALCRAGASLQGQWPLALLARLQDCLPDGAGQSDATVQWAIEGSLRPAGGAQEMWLHLRASAAVVLQCQRCLKALPHRLQTDRKIRFVEDEDEAARLDEELEDDVMALEPRMDSRALVEDELILALPLVPRHASCEAAVPLTAGLPPGAPAADEPPHPFAALAALRRRGG